MPGKNVFYYKCPDHRKNYVMSFAFQFDREDDVYEVGIDLHSITSDFLPVELVLTVLSLPVCVLLPVPK